MKVTYAKKGEPLWLGHEGENKARQIIFYISHWQELYGPGTAELAVKRADDASPYPASVEVDGSAVKWTITSADVAQPGKNGRAELRYYVGDTLVKSSIWMTTVSEALGVAGEAPQPPEQSWVDQVIAAGAQAAESAQRAEDAAQRAEDAAERAENADGSGAGGDEKQDKLTGTHGQLVGFDENGNAIAIDMDTTPTADSAAPVTSGGIKAYIDAVVGDIGSILDEINGEAV